MATSTMLTCKVSVERFDKEFIHQVKACQQVWASTVKSFEIAFKSLAPNPPNQEALNTLESTLFITRASELNIACFKQNRFEPKERDIQSMSSRVFIKKQILIVFLGLNKFDLNGYNI